MSPAADDQEDRELRALALRHRGALARLCRHYEADEEARRDLEQEILVALFTARASFRRDSSERTWVLRIAHNVASTHVARAVRARRDDGAAAPPEPAAGPDEAALGRDLARRLDQRLRRFDLASRQLVLLALEGCTTQEIADVTGLSPTNVTTKLSRIRRALTTEDDHG